MSGRRQSEGSKLYGFHYDSVLKRYFKISSDPKSPYITRPYPPDPIAEEAKAKLLVNYGDRTDSIKISGIPKSLQLRQLGCTRPSTFNSGVRKMKLSRFEASTSRTICAYMDVVSCSYVKGMDNYLFGAWSLSSTDESVVFKGVRMDFLQARNEVNGDSYFCNRNILFFKVDNEQKMSDICIGDWDKNSLFVSYLGYSYQPGISLRSNIRGFTVPRTPDAEESEIEGIFDFQQTDACQSCAFGSCQKFFAIGAERCVRIFVTSNNGLYKRSLPGSPFTMDFTGCNRLLYCGLHNGSLCATDLRAPSDSPVAANVQLGRSIVNIKLLENERNIIVSGYNDTLVNVDLRFNQVLFNYPHHVNKCKKLMSLSCDETVNVLCSPGQDNITRLWSLNEGKLLSSIPAPLWKLKDNLHQSWFESSEIGPVVHVFQNDSAFLYEA